MQAPTLLDDMGRVVLNMPRLEDAEALEACHDTDWCWAFWKAAKPSLEQTVRDLQVARFHWGRRNSRDRTFAIRETTEGSLIGLLRIHPSAREPKGTARFDIELAPEQRGAGKGGATLCVALRYAFVTLAYVVAEMEIRPGNAPMEGLAARCGFRKLGPRGMPSGEITNAYQMRHYEWEWAQDDRSRT